MELLTQVEVERRMYAGGIQRAETMMLRAEEAGRANQNPYAKQVMRDFVLPIAETVRNDVAATGKAGRLAAHVALLRPLDPDAVAFLAIRQALNACMDPKGSPNTRTIAHRIGATINSELVLAQLEAANPELYHTLANDLARRLSKDERHRMTLYKMQATKAGIVWVEWPVGAKDQVGMYMLGLMEQAGMVELIRDTNKFTDRRTGQTRHAPTPVVLAPALIETIQKIKGYVAITAPVYGPCVEPPQDWTDWGVGGFHTHELRRTLPRLVKCHPSARGHVFSEPAPTVWAAANMLQRTAWQVNQDIYDVVLQLSIAGVDTDEIVSNVDKPRPEKPGWLPPEKLDKAAMNEGQRAEFAAWKLAMTEWHTQRKLAGVRYGRFYSATRAAAMFRDYPTLHFVYFADSRGRFYPMTYGVNPQGSDLQKALLRFANGKPLDTAEAIRWFHILGANKYGFDKATLSERFMWAHEKREWILHIVSDPVNHREWMEAGDPLQFLAWCFEYADWVRDPDGFRSHLPVNMDGSCNGLQNLSAMLRDEVGGKATNLTVNEVMEDIYRRVAEAAVLRMQRHVFTDDPDKEELRQLWLANGVSRSVVKRSVMTTPYGVTNRSATDYVVSDYLSREPTLFVKARWRKAAQTLMFFVWPAIGDVVVKGRLAMDWLKRGARAIVKDLAPEEEPLIFWRTPSGFPASQAYYEVNEHRINTRLAGTETIRLVVLSEKDTPDRNRHASGLAPNFVHSLDAAHLHRVAARCATAGIGSLMAVHDDYGTHAADAHALFNIIREEFAAMYTENDPVMDFFNKYPIVGQPPAKGTLDIQEVLKSDFFFS